MWVETGTSKYVLSNLPPQKPLAAMSRRAPSWTLDEAPVRDSPVIGCNSGSIQTSLQTLGSPVVPPPLLLVHDKQESSTSFQYCI